ncbi:LamG-like jellyroll fold domain-containing protein [Streptomyces sp. NPDC059629]|uniref:LamG-like jellyroll fold domain-containing protein n=1 Tax=Streptomyces sp. NPDC059629 TaxID=3346889 RepID=UPI0036AE3CC4
MPANADEPSPSDPMLAAQAQAVASGHDVPVESLTTETSTVTASPDGMFTSTINVMPVRVLKDGAWTPVDATLATNADGTLSPKATPNDVTLSGGGSGPLVTMANEDGHSMALTMPFTLPAPTVSDDTAVYKSVLPGVDLSVSVTDQGGFSDVLIVHDAAAAADPHIKKLTEAASTQGLTLSATDSGGMNATTADGTVAYTSPRPLMWDSSTTSDAPATTAPASDTTTGGDAPTASSADGPGEGANVNTVPMSTTSSGITLAPDTSVLNAPDTTYPVYIDPFSNPVTEDAGHYDEVYSSSTCADSPQYDKPQTLGEGVGYQRRGGVCGTGLERSYYTIPTDKLDPSMHVYDAQITVSSTYAASWDCSQNQPITLHTTESIDSGTDWNNKPKTIDDNYPPVKITIPSGANSNSSCSNHPATFNVLAQAQRIATDHSASGDHWTIGLFGNESISSSNDDYLRMSSSLSLTVRFDIPPDIPTSLKTTPSATGATGACVMSGDGWIGAVTYSGAGSNIQLHAKVSANVSGELVKAHYHVWDRTVLDSSGNAYTDSTPDSGLLASGSDAVMPIGFTLKDGHEYGWDVYAQDNNAQLSLTSDISDHCWFKTDFTPPDTPDIATNKSFPPAGTGPANPLVYAGPDTTPFTVTATDAAPADTSCTPNACLSSGVDHFLWQLDSQPTANTGTPAAVTSSDSSGTATGTIPVPITHWGIHTLYVAAVDAAGNISQAPASYTFTIPWNPKTKITPGDISGDGIPDLLATTKTGDLELIPGNTDPAQSPTPAQTGPIATTPAPAINGPVLVSTPDDSPDQSTWNNYLIAHRGNLHGAEFDDLFAYNKQTKQLYIIKNDHDPVDSSTSGEKYSTFPGYVDKRFNTVTKENCASSDIVADDTRCRTAGYNNAGWDITQLLTPGNVYGNPDNYPAVITVENKKLWLYQSDSIGHLKNPILLGDGDWSGLTLIAPGTVGGTFSSDSNGDGKVTGGTPTLWARDNTTGALYTYSLALGSDGLPPLLHATTHTALPLTLPPTTYPQIASSGDVNSLSGGPDGNPDLYVTDTHGELIEYPGTAPTSTTANFAASVSLGTAANAATHWWNLDDGTGATAADCATATDAGCSGGLPASLSGAYTWATDGQRGKVLNFTGTTGYAATSGPAVDTSKSFTVSAWVNPASLTANSTFVSQSDTAGNSNGFQLYYSSSKHAWAFNLHNDKTGTSFTATYGGTPTTGQWAHLVGVYDASANQITLYVNGRQVDTKAFGGIPWNATGPVQIGRRIALGSYGEYANSAISDIHIYNTALPPADAAATGDNPAISQLD